MKAASALLVALVSLGFASSVEVGTAEFPTNMPFCAN
jgi:hypothetical protein